MNATRIELDLSQHCIQTAAKHEYQRLVRQLLDTADPQGTIEAKIELVTDFLEQTDFKRLRSEHPELTGGSPVVVVLCRDKSGRAVWSIRDGSA